MQKISSVSQFKKMDWKQTNGQTDTTDCITFNAKAGGNKD